MELSKCRDLARQLLNFHGLTAVGWTFKFDNARSRGGQCMHTAQTISMSRHLVPMWTEDAVRNTLLHEIAHALVGPGVGHGAAWAAKANQIGYVGGRTHNEVTVPKRYEATCLTCGKVVSGRHRLSASMARGAVHSVCGTRVVWRDTKLHVTL